MNNFETANAILNDILFKEVPFALATKNTFDKSDISKDSRVIVTGLVGCELRHHLLFRALLKEKLEYTREEETKFLSLYLLMANELYYHRFEYDQIIQNASKLSSLPVKDINSIIQCFKQADKLLPYNVQEGSLEHLSYRFNTPLWLVKMWDKQYGRSICFKTLKSNSKSNPVTVGVNSKVTSVEKLLASKDFILSNIQNCLIYQGKEVLRNTSYTKYHQVYLEKMPYIDIINKLEFDAFKKAAIFSGYTNNLLLDFMLLKKPNTKVDIMVPDFKDYVDAKNAISQFHLENVQVYDAKASVIESCVSEPVDLFFLLARNTNYENFNRMPDYFLQCKNQKLDSLINEQRYSLEEAYKVLNVNGQLIYMVPTLNKKETTLLIKDFLLIHRDVSLLEEKHYMPFDECGSMMYYVKMLKTNKRYD